MIFSRRFKLGAGITFIATAMLTVVVLIWRGSTKTAVVPSPLSAYESGDSSAIASLMKEVPIVSESDEVEDLEGFESYPAWEEEISNKAFAARYAAYPWSQSLPEITDHFVISYVGLPNAPAVEIILTSKNGVEFAAYRAEAIAWLAEKGAPVDTLKITVRYRGQR